MKRFGNVLAAACLAYGCSAVAHASLILVDPLPLGGQGLGAVATVLTLTSPGSSTNETGCISPSGTSGCGFADSNVQNGQSQVQPYDGTAAALRIIFNASEPGNDNLVTLNNLVLNVYNGSALIFTSGTLSGAPLNLVPFQGTGNAGYQFRLDTTQAGQLQTALTTAGVAANIQVGLGASLSNASGGLETFNIATADPSSDDAVPEPSTYALMGAGLLLTLALKHRSS